MGAKDTKAKEFLANDSRFADVFNYYLFEGQPVIKPEDLKEKDTAEVLSLYGTAQKEVQKQKWRDLLKSAIVKTSKQAVYVLLGMEHQSSVHYAMPVKNMIYDAMNYGSQVTEAATEHRMKKNYQSEAEFLSGFTKEDRLTPVITLTLYLGADEWDGPRSLHEMFETKDAEILKYIDDYHLHLLVPHEITDFGKFKTSIGEVLEMVKVSNSKTEMEKVLKNNPAFRKLENEAVSAINVFAGIDISVNDEDEVTDMCKAWEDQKNEGIEQGIKQGIEQGRMNTLVEKTCKKLAKSYTVSEIADALEEDETIIQRICNVAEKYMPDYDMDVILQELRAELKTV